MLKGFVQMSENEMKEKLQYPVAKLGLNVRTLNLLDSMGVKSVGELLNCTREQLEAQKLFGEKSINEVYRKLARIGFSYASNGDSQDENQE